MKKGFYTIILLLLVSQLFGQTEIFDQSVLLDQDLSNQGAYNVRASQIIKLQPGFRFDASSDDFNASIELKELLPLEEESLTGGPSGDIGTLVGTDGVVGAIPGSFNVSPSGAATYTIPIECPAGINGMTPQVSLTYNSQAGNGIAGWGWNIAGTSTISRVAKNVFYDSKSKEIQFDDTDVFAFNGIRMFEIDDGDGINSTKEYKLENDPTVRIRAYGCNANGPYYFIVYSGDGKISYYGNTQNSQMYDQWESSTSHTSEHTFSWNLSKVEDSYGNYIEYLYKSDIIDNDLSLIFYGSYRLSKIKYTGNGTSEPYYIVEFDYISRPDYSVNYISSKKVENSKILDKITVSYGSTVLKTYSLVTNQIGVYSHLKSVELEGMNGQKYNKTVFTHTEEDEINEATLTISESTLSTDKDLEQIIPGDFNGDGISDFCVRYSNEVDDTTFFWYAFYVSEYNQGTLTTSHAGTTQIGKKWSYGIDNIVYDQIPIFGDFNWDGKTDLVSIERNHSWCSYRVYGIDYNYMTSSVSLTLEWENSYNFKGANFEGDEFPIPSVGEVNGDGKPDLILINQNTNIVNGDVTSIHNVRLILSGSTQYSSHIDEIQLNDERIHTFYVFDMNGDGLSDILCLQETDESKVSFCSADEAYYSTPSLPIPISSNYEINGIGRFNRDNLNDLVIKRKYSSDYYILYNNGDELVKTPVYLASYSRSDLGITDESDDCFITDLNNDGLSDIIIEDEIYTQPVIQWNYDHSIWKWFECDGDGFIHLDQDMSTGDWEELRSTSFTVGDFTGDGIIDELYHSDNEDLFKITNKYITSGINDKLITKITNGMGNEISVSYSKMIDTKSSSSIYNSTEQNYPIQSINTPVIHLVSSVDNGLSTDNYIYYDALFSYDKGYLGMQKYSAENNISNILVETETFLEYEYYTPDIITTKTYLNKSTPELIAESQKEFDPHQIFEKRFLLKPMEEYTYNKLKDATVETIFSNHNVFGAPETIVKKTFSNQGLDEDLKETTTLVYEHRTQNPWMIGLVTKKTTTLERVTGTHTTELEIEYNDQGSISIEYSNKTDNLEIKNSYSYDPIYGILEEVTTEALNDVNVPQSNKSKTISYSYSDDNRFRETTTNSLGHVHSVQYDPVTGSVSSKTDENGRISEYLYDGLFQRYKIKYPTGIEQYSNSFWADGHEDAPDDALYYTLTQESGKAEQITFFDQYGRKVRSVFFNFDGSKLYIQYEYNSENQLESVSLPYSPPGQAEYFTVYSYDDYGRRINTTTPDQRFSSISYENDDYILETLGKKNGLPPHEKKIYLNALDEPVRIIDSEDKEILIQYYATGKPKEYDYGNGNKVMLEYDLNGNRTKITDPNAGTIFSTYNAYGELVSQISANENLTEYTYDKLSRITSAKSYLGSSTLKDEKIYLYDSEYIGKLSSIVLMNQSDPISELSYTYDHDGRISTEYEKYEYNLSNSSFDKHITYVNEYDDIGRLEKRIYPDGFEVNYSYNYYGVLKSIKALGKTLWKCENVNKLGQITDFSMGGRVTHTTYNPYGELISTNLSAYKDINYTFDDYGNIKSREDESYGLKEIFEYDQMNRLTSIKYYKSGIHQIASDITMIYDSEGYGNIESKNDIGNFSYGESITSPEGETYTGGPHALTSIDNLDNYRPNPQSIEYTIFNKVSSITETDENNQEITLLIKYGIDRQRRKTIFEDDKIPGYTRIKYFFGDYEEVHEDGIIRKYHYVHAPTGLCAIFESQSDNNGGINSTLWHVNTDHLGSPTIIFNAANHSNTVEYSFSAWGIPRDPTDWSKTAKTNLLADRGYTGHEHLASFSLINMNGRIYDPILARFLSPDPYIQMPEARSGFNRYSYVLNNPLLYTDPSGESALLTLGLTLAGMYVGGAAANNSFNPAAWDLDFETVAGIVTGGLIGFTGAYSISNPGVLQNISSLITPIGQFGGAGYKNNWEFHWKTIAGGGGSLSFNEQNSYSNESNLFQLASQKQKIFYPLETYNYKKHIWTRIIGNEYFWGSGIYATSTVKIEEINGEYFAAISYTVNSPFFYKEQDNVQGFGIVKVSGSKSGKINEYPIKSFDVNSNSTYKQSNQSTSKGNWNFYGPTKKYGFARIPLPNENAEIITLRIRISYVLTTTAPESRLAPYRKAKWDLNIGYPNY